MKEKVLNPKISIIVPIYKVEKYLVQCIDSILNQTFKDIEVILIDEGDMDECRKIIDSYEFGERKDERVKTIHEKNGGYGASCNKGFNIAKGEYIGIVESDDFASLDMFENLYKIAKEFDADVVKSDWYDYWTDKNLSRKNNRISPAKANKLTNFEQDPSILRINPSVWSAIYKKEFLDKNNIRFLETKGGSYQDLSFTFKVYSLAKRVVLTDKAYIHYRQDNMNASVKQTNKIYCVCDEYDEISRFIGEHPEFSDKLKEHEEIIRYTAYVSSAIRLSEDLRPQFMEVFSKHFKEEYEKGTLQKTFFRKINKKEFMTLINNPDKYLKVIKTKEFKKKFNIIRKKILSIHFRNGRLNITLLGKEIL